MKKPISFFLSALLLIGCTVPAFAAEPSLEEPTAIVSQVQRIATKADIYEELSKLGVDYMIPTDGQNEATVMDFLLAFSRHGRYISETAEGFLYLLGDSKWMTEEEWNDLISHINDPIPLSQVQDIIQRTVECNALLSSHYIPDTFERYKDVIDTFYGEFSGLLENNKAAVKYWVDVLAGGGFYDHSFFSSVLHETAHEVSARKANDFQTRKCNGDTWQVIWAHTPSVIYPYNPKTGENAKVPIQSIVKTSSIVSAKYVPEEVRNTSWYKIYFSSDSASCVYGVYGMLEEYCASAIDIRCNIISSSIKYHENGFCEDYLQSFYFWDGAIGTYLSRLHATNPGTYEKIMSNEAFIKTLTDTTDYIKEQINWIHVIPTDDESVIALREWAKTSGLQVFLAEMQEDTAA